METAVEINETLASSTQTRRDETNPGETNDWKKRRLARLAGANHRLAMQT